MKCECLCVAVFQYSFIYKSGDEPDLAWGPRRSNPKPEYGKGYC